MHASIQGHPDQRAGRAVRHPAVPLRRRRAARRRTGAARAARSADRILYSAKANPNVSVCAVFRALGAGLEVSSLAELVTALRAGADPGGHHLRRARQVDRGAGGLLRARHPRDGLRVTGRAGRPGRPGAARRTRVLMRVNPPSPRRAPGSPWAASRASSASTRNPARAPADAAGVAARAASTGIHVYLGTRILDAADVVHNTRGDPRRRRGAVRRARHARCRPSTSAAASACPTSTTRRTSTWSRRLTASTTPWPSSSPDWPGPGWSWSWAATSPRWAGTYVVRVRYVKESRGEWFVVTDGGTHHHMARSASAASSSATSRSAR